MTDFTFEKFLREQYHPMNADEADLNGLLEAIKGLNSDTRIREHLTSLDQDESLNEKRVRFKRKYGERPHVEAYTQTKVRNDILEYIEKFGIVSHKNMMMFFEMMGEEREGNKPHKTWFNKNCHLVKTTESGGHKFYKLTKYGKRLLERVREAMGKSKIAESAVQKLKSQATKINEVSASKMKNTIESVADQLRKQGYTVDYSSMIISVEDNKGNTVFVAQGEEATNMQDDAERASMKFDVSEEDYILHMLDSSGAI